jgi:signal peptidase
MLKKIFFISEWILFGIIVCLCGLLLLSNYTTHFPLKVYTVLTGSMEPAIPAGSLVLGFTIDSTQLNPGDIITFASPDEPGKQIIHRIRSVKTADNQTYFLTKGDNNDSLDDWQIYPPQIFSRAYLFIPQLGYLASQSKSPLGFVATVGIPALFLLIMYVRQIIQGVREYADHKAQKAVGEYIHSQRKAQVLHQMLKVGALVFFLPVTTVYAAFSANININNVTFTTASSFSSTSPSPQPSVSVTPTPSNEPSISPSPTTTPSVMPSSTPTLSPSPSGSPCSSNCSKIILHQSGSSSSVNVHTTTGSTTVTVNGQSQNSSNSQNTQIHIQSNTQ